LRARARRSPFVKTLLAIVTLPPSVRHHRRGMPQILAPNINLKN
jgi:hypothetical protein